MADKLPVEAMSPEPKEADDADYVAPLASSKTAKSDATVMKNLYFGQQEKSFQESPYYPDSLKKPYNPDPLIMRDTTYKIYEDMLDDDQVNVALDLKKDLVIGSGWHINFEDEDVKREIEESLNTEPDRPFSEILQDILQAYDFGFSLSEKIFKNSIDGQLALKDIKPRHPSTWLIHSDEHGNVTRFEQRGPKGSVDVNPDSLIHYVNNQRYQNPYGRSDLKAAYQAYLTKRHITRFYAIFLENAAGAKPVAKYDRRASQAVVDDVFEAIKKFQTKTAMVIPKEFEMEFLEAKSNGEAYIKGINLFNMFIGRALFIPDLLGFSGSETSGGSHSLGKEQVELFYKHIFRRREILERIINQHVIRPMCVYNYGLMDSYPQFKFNPLSDEDAVKQSELWIKGVQGAGWQPTPEEINHFRSMVKFPISDDVLLKSDVAHQQAMEAGGLEQDADDEMKASKMPSKGNMMGSKGADDAGKKKAFALALSTLPGAYKKKVDFKLADSMLKSFVKKIIAETEPIVEDMFEDLYDQLAKKKVIEKQDLSRIDALKLFGLKKLQLILKRNFRRLYSDAKDIAKTEVRKEKTDYEANIPSDEFLSFVEQETYKYIGDYSYSITKLAKDKIIQAIKDGMPLSSVVGILDDDGKKLSDVSLERYARTKTTEVFNRGRMEYFESTGIVAAYQYSAILDDVTSEICGELNGLIFNKEDAPVPPLHFNCRSILVPITKYEDHSIDKVTNSGQNVDKFITENVTDNGFSRN